MGLLIDGQWHDAWYDTKESRGRFVRTEAQFRNWVTADGSAGPSGRGGFRAEPNRYHLYVAFACPWAHRTLIFRKLKGLESLISVSAVNSYMGEDGWTFDAAPETIPDDVNHARKLYELYTLADRHYSGRSTIPILWDKKERTIVSNESSEIIRMLNSAFDGVGANGNDYYPKELRSEIDEWNALIYPNVNNGVYRAGFATTLAPESAISGHMLDGLCAVPVDDPRMRWTLSAAVCTDRRMNAATAVVLNAFTRGSAARPLELTPSTVV